MKLDEMRKLMQLSSLDRTADPGAVYAQLRALGIDPSHLYQELEMSSEYVNTHRDVSDSLVPLSLHSHNYYEILYCRSAADVEYLVGSARYRLQRGDIVFVPPGVSHRPIFPERMTEPYARDVLWLSQKFVDTIDRMFPDHSSALRDHSVPMRTAGTRWEFLGDLFRAGVREEEEKRPGWEAAVMGNTLQILANMKRAYIERSAGTMEAERRELPDRITSYIETNYASHISLEDLARRFYISESTVSHLFKQKMGVSIYRYVTQRRLIAAKERINRNDPLESVAAEVGFADYSTFYRAFRQEYGISPRQYRKLQQPQR